MTGRFVINGVYILHKLLWLEEVPFQKIVDTHTEYKINKYGKPDFIFDR